MTEGQRTKDLVEVCPPHPVGDRLGSDDGRIAYPRPWKKEASEAVRTSACSNTRSLAEGGSSRFSQNSGAAVGRAIVTCRWSSASVSLTISRPCRAEVFQWMVRESSPA